MKVEKKLKINILYVDDEVENLSAFKAIFRRFYNVFLAESGREGKEILKGVNLKTGPGEVHAIMGPNGSGKSTFAAVLAGREEYEITEGSIDFEGNDLLDLKTKYS